MNNKKSSLSLWWPVLIVKGIWWLISLMALSLIHYDDCNVCVRESYRRPRRVDAAMRQGIRLTNIGCGLFCFISCMFVVLCIYMCAHP